jgi:uncharacterized Zn-finger protein
MQGHHSRLDILADVSRRDMGHPIHPFGHEEHSRRRSDEANPSTSDSRQGLDIPANRDRSWTCAECGMIFPKSKLLETHARFSKHKAYRCSRDPLCRKAFGMRTAASRHEATHSALMKHACSKCSARFRRRDHCLEHEAVCVASLPLLITCPVSAQASGSEPRAAAPVSTPGREQQSRIDADEIPTPFAYGDQHHMNTISHDWYSPGHYSPGLSPSGLTNPTPANLQTYHTSNRAPAGTTSTDADSGSRISPNPMNTAQDTQQFDEPQQMRVDPLTPKLVFQETYEPQPPAKLYTCTLYGCSQRCDNHLDLQKHKREHHDVELMEKTQRDYILDLATRTSARRRKCVQSYGCNLCPKRFTRFATLREHLRTHTDERLVCTICGKAFVRQHDLSRHKKLHSGEKMFVCRGTLHNGASWGCGVRFARIDALGRHFRSYRGRICNRPLLDEDRAEKRKAWLQGEEKTRAESVPVPVALLQQYPALATIDWELPREAALTAAEEACCRRSVFDVE